MNIAATVCRYLLGLLFLVFGLNGFLHFIPQPPPPPGLALDYFTVMIKSHYLVLPFLLQIAGAVLLLAGRFVPLGLVLLGPVIVNILLFHALMAPAGLPPGLVAAVLWFVVFLRHRAAFAGIFAARA
ncbi:MAG: hypothetical protein INR65_11600 [Gluconacetobacter diazotrophicus]|nr:hypothetical protein [Gluconacetobacter diazotrophicus]